MTNPVGGAALPTTLLNFAPASASKRFPALSKSDPRITPMWKFVAEARRVLWTFVELGFLAVLAIILIHLLLGEGAGSYVTSVSDNVTKFATSDTWPWVWPGVARSRTPVMTSSPGLRMVTRSLRAA